MTPATSTTEAAWTAEALGDALRFSRERMSTSNVEGAALGVVIRDMAPEDLRMDAPLPRGGADPDGGADPVDVSTLIAVLIDSGAGLASASGAPFGSGGSTIELRIDYAEPVQADVRQLSVEGRRLHIAGSAVLADGVVTDDRGRVLARGQGYFARSFDGPVAKVELPAKAPVGSRLAELRAALTLPAPAGSPAVPVAGEEHDRELQLSAMLANGRGQMHGAMVFVLAEQAQRQALGAVARLLTMHVEYVRPAVCDGSPARLRSEFARRGRRFATLRTELIRPDGKPAMIVTGLWSTEP